jgi:hypothetical protein
MRVGSKRCRRCKNSAFCYAHGCPLRVADILIDTGWPKPELVNKFVRVQPKNCPIREEKKR